MNDKKTDPKTTAKPAPSAPKPEAAKPEAPAKKASQAPNPWTTKRKELMLSIEQLWAWVVATDRPKKGGPDDRMDSQIRIEGSVTYAANQVKGLAMKLRRTEHPSDKGERFISLIPSQVARSCAEAWGRAGQAMQGKLTKPTDPNVVEQAFILEDLDGQVEPTEVIFSPAIERFRDVEGALKRARHGKRKAKLALDSASLAKLVTLRSKIGGHGPIMFEIRGETDEVWAGWVDGVGHQVQVLIATSKLEESDWKASESW